MAVFLVTWDINRAKLNYNQARANLIAQLERYDHIRDPGLDSVWFLHTNQSAFDLVASIRVALDGNDRLIATKLVAPDHEGFMMQDIWNWIYPRL